MPQTIEEYTATIQKQLIHSTSSCDVDDMLDYDDYIESSEDEEEEEGEDEEMVGSDEEMYYEADSGTA